MEHLVRRAVVVALALTLSAAPVAAQDAADPLADLLAMAPATSLADGPVSYVDHRAVEATRPGAAQPQDVAALTALEAADDPAFRRWIAAFNGVASGSPELLRGIFVGGPDWPELMGFDFFDIDRQLHLGQPPTQGLVLAGRFDPAAIAAAHVARGFTSEDLDGWTRVCGPDGCDEGMMLDLEAREPRDPFGGMLGRRQPLYASESMLLSSADHATIRALLAAGGGEVVSLADVPEVQLFLDAIPDGAVVRQAMLLPPGTFVADLAGMLLAAPSEEELRQRLAELAMEPMPAASLAMFVDTAEGEEQVTHVLLGYGSEADAATAAAVLPGRIETLPSMRTDQPLRDLFADRGVTSVEATVHPAADGTGAATVLTLRSPLPSEGPDDGSTPLEPSSLGYRMLVEMVAGRDTLWLAPELPALD